MTCPRCGQPGDSGRYCGRCGLLLTGPSGPVGPVRLDKTARQPPVGPGPVGSEQPGWLSPRVPFLPPPDPATRYPGPAPAGIAPRGPQTGRAAILALVVALVLLAVGAATFVALRGDGSGDVTTVVAATTAAPPTTAGRATSTPPVTTAVSTVVVTSTVAPPTTATPAATGLSDVTAQPIACNSGYFVLVASENDQGSFTRRVDEVRAAGQLPSGSHWTQTSSGCALFTSSGASVLWSGPYPTAAQACAVRLTSPYDAPVRGTVPGGDGVSSCVCPAAVGSLPPLDAGSARSQWIGELQRLLPQLDYDVGELDADSWGVYTPALADAVRRFQGDRGLTVTGQVDGATWSTLRSAGC